MLLTDGTHTPHHHHHHRLDLHLSRPSAILSTTPSHSFINPVSFLTTSFSFFSSSHQSMRDSHSFLLHLQQAARRLTTTVIIESCTIVALQSFFSTCSIETTRTCAPDTTITPILCTEAQEVKRVDTCVYTFKPSSCMIRTRCKPL